MKQKHDIKQKLIDTIKSDSWEKLDLIQQLINEIPEVQAISEDGDVMAEAIAQQNIEVINFLINKGFSLAGGIQARVKDLTRDAKPQDDKGRLALIKSLFAYIANIELSSSELIEEIFSDGTVIFQTINLCLPSTTAFLLDQGANPLLVPQLGGKSALQRLWELVMRLDPKQTRHIQPILSTFMEKFILPKFGLYLVCHNAYSSERLQDHLGVFLKKNKSALSEYIKAKKGGLCPLEYALQQKNYFMACNLIEVGATITRVDLVQSALKDFNLKDGSIVVDEKLRALLKLHKLTKEKFCIDAALSVQYQYMNTTLENAQRSKQTLTALFLMSMPVVAPTSTEVATKGEEDVSMTSDADDCARALEAIEEAMGALHVSADKIRDTTSGPLKRSDEALSSAPPAKLTRQHASLDLMSTSENDDNPSHFCSISTTSATQPYWQVRAAGGAASSSNAAGFSTDSTRTKQRSFSVEL